MYVYAQEHSPSSSAASSRPLPTQCAQSHFALHDEVVHSSGAVHCKLRGGAARQTVLCASVLQLLPHVRQSHTTKLQQVGIRLDEVTVMYRQGEEFLSVIHVVRISLL